MDAALSQYLLQAAKVSPILEVFVRFFATWAIVILAGLAIACTWRHKWHGVTALFVAVVAAFAINVSIGTLIPRERPFYTERTQPLFVPMSEKSLPSDHAALAFSLTGVVWFYCRRPRAAAVAIAVGIAIARVMAGVHYPADVVVGAVVGLIGAAISIRLVGRPYALSLHK